MQQDPPAAQTVSQTHSLPIKQEQRPAMHVHKDVHPPLEALHVHPALLENVSIQTINACRAYLVSSPLKSIQSHVICAA